MGEDSESSSGDENSNVLPMCYYGRSCYRKNPVHFRQFRHPSKATATNSSISVNNRQEIVEVRIEVGLKATKKTQLQGDSHEWTVFVRCPGGNAIEYFVEKVVFKLPEDFPHPVLEVTEAPFSVTDTSSSSFHLKIDVFFRCIEEPKKLSFDYDVDLREVSYTTVRVEKLTFQNPTAVFREKILKAGGVVVASADSTTSMHGVGQPGPSGMNPRRGVFSQSLTVSVDEFDAFGQLCASKLRKLECPTQKMFAEKLVLEVLCQAEMKRLSSESCSLVADLFVQSSESGSGNQQNEIIKREVEDNQLFAGVVVKVEVEDNQPSTGVSIKRETEDNESPSSVPIKQEVVDSQSPNSVFIKVEDIIDIEDTVQVIKEEKEELEVEQILIE